MFVNRGRYTRTNHMTYSGGKVTVAGKVIQSNHSNNKDGEPEAVVDIQIGWDASGMTAQVHITESDMLHWLSLISRARINKAKSRQAAEAVNAATDALNRAVAVRDRMRARKAAANG